MKKLYKNKESIDFCYLPSNFQQNGKPHQKQYDLHYKLIQALDYIYGRDYKFELFDIEKHQFKVKFKKTIYIVKYSKYKIIDDTLYELDENEYKKFLRKIKLKKLKKFSDEKI